MCLARACRRRGLAAALLCVLLGGGLVTIVTEFCVAGGETTKSPWIPRGSQPVEPDLGDAAQTNPETSAPDLPQTPPTPGSIWRPRSGGAEAIGKPPPKSKSDSKNKVVPAALRGMPEGPELFPSVRKTPDTLPALLPDPVGPRPNRDPNPKARTAADAPVPKLSVEPKDEEIPTPPTRILPTPRADESDTEREIVLGAARNSVRQRNWDQAILRFEEFFRRFGDDGEVREEFAGVLVQADRLRAALAEYARAVVLRPNVPRLRIAYGDTAVAAREYALAIVQFQAAHDLEPKNLATAVRLARGYGFDGDTARAQAFYDRLLRTLPPDDEDAPPAIAALLVDLDRPAEALAFLNEFLKRGPNDAELHALRVRAFDRIGDPLHAREALDALHAAAPRDLNVRRELAESLYGADAFELALLVYDQMLQIDPAYVPALLGAARAHFQLLHPQAGRRMLECVRPTPRTERDCRLAWATYHRTVGEYVEAKQIFQDLLRFDADDHECRLELADLYERQREDDKAKAEFAKVPSGSGLGRRARLGTASVLVQQRRFAEAAETCKQVLTENPADASATGQLIRALARGGRGGEGAALARGYMLAHPRNEPGQTAVRLALARALFEDRKPRECAMVCEQLFTRPGGRIPETFYLLARARDLAGDKDGARFALAQAAMGTAGDTRIRLLIADLFIGDADDPAAAELVSAALKIDGDNLAILTRWAEIQGRLARQSGVIFAAVQAARAVLDLSPTNYRGRLALARTLPIGREWQGAASEYDRATTADPELFVPQREKARTLYGGNNHLGGAAAFLRLQTPDAGEQLRVALIDLAQRDPRVQVVIGACLAEPAPAHLLKAEVAKVVGGLHDPELSAALQRVLLDHEARATEQTLARLEGEEKAKNWKPYAVIPIARTLLDIEPSNTAVMFDVGQAHGSLRQTRAAIDAYNRDLAIDPNERDAAVAQQRAGLELNPALDLGFEYFDQRGRDGLAQVARTRYRAFARLPWGDEDEFVGLGYARANYRPNDDTALQGNILIGRAQGKPIETLLLYGQTNYESYRDRFRDRVTFDIGARYDCTDQVVLRAGGFLENVVENGESMRQDIHRGGLRLGADYRHSRRWLFSGTYTYARYSDENDYNDLYLVGEHTLCFAPNQLKVALSGDFYGFREPTVFPNANPNVLFGAIHPYFSPKSFAYVEGRIEWTQWLSRDYFVHSNQCWYSLQYGLAFDNQMVAYNTVRGLFNYDVKPWLSIGAEARGTFSDVYRVAGATAYVVFRFPQPLW